MRRVAIAVALAFAVTLAVVVGQRMSAEAMAVVVGVVCGVAAGIPMSVLLMVIMTRRERQMEEPPYGQGGRYGAYPPVVVIQGGTPAPNGLLPPYHAHAVEAAPREFRIVGEE
nr:hypothetical protein [Chloroflexota bacterium]